MQNHDIHPILEKKTARKGPEKRGRIRGNPAAW